MELWFLGEVPPRRQPKGKLSNRSESSIEEKSKTLLIVPGSVKIRLSVS